MKDLDDCNRRPTLSFRLTSHTPFAIFMRVLINTLIALITIKIMSSLMSDLPHPEKGIIKHYLYPVIFFNVVGEFQILLDKVLQRYLPIPHKLRIRLFLQIVLTVLFIGIIQRISMIYTDPVFLSEKFLPYLFIGYLLGFLFISMFSSGLIITRLSEVWIEQQQKISEIEQQKLQLDYNALQDQLNPHFLFNNLSVLKSLIMYDKESALKFTENFTDVYRYVLKSRENLLVELKKELEFVKSYTALHMERLGNGLEIKLFIEEKYKLKKIAPLSLQMLIENAIKHNIASPDEPLLIRISAVNNKIIVENNIKPRNTSYSTNTGLSNLQKRYSILGNEHIEIEKTVNTFKVILPLIS